MLKGADIDGKDLRIMRNLYWKQILSVRVADEASSSQEIKRGVRQGCVLSPERDLSDHDGIKFGGRNINNVIYAVDTELNADSEEKLQNLVQSLVRASGERGFKVKVSMTKMTIISKGEGNVGINIMMVG